MPAESDRWPGRRHGFAVVRRGYEPAQVDQALAEPVSGAWPGTSRTAFASGGRCCRIERCSCVRHARNHLSTSRSTHRSKLVKEFVASTEARLKLFVLPAYSPQL